MLNHHVRIRQAAHRRVRALLGNDQGMSTIEYSIVKLLLLVSLCDGV